MLGIVVACVHCIAIASAINPSPPSEFPAVFLGCPSPFSRREMVKGYKEFSRRERVSTCLLRGNLDVVQKMGWLSAGGGGGCQTESE
jgi:hypothetical protein